MRLPVLHPSLKPCPPTEIYGMQIDLLSVCVCVCEHGSCDKIYIFNEMERDVGESKVRGDTHTHTDAHTSNIHAKPLADTL